jgi:hypothetical protein
MHMNHQQAADRRARIAELIRTPMTRKAATKIANEELGYSSPVPSQVAGTVLIPGTTDLISTEDQ